MRAGRKFLCSITNRRHSPDRMPLASTKKRSLCAIIQRATGFSSCPPLPMLSAMGWPMMPRPMKPTFMRDPDSLAVVQALRER